MQQSKVTYDSAARELSRAAGEVPHQGATNLFRSSHRQMTASGPDLP